MGIIENNTTTSLANCSTLHDVVAFVYIFWWRVCSLEIYLFSAEKDGALSRTWEKKERKSKQDKKS